MVTNSEIYPGDLVRLTRDEFIESALQKSTWDNSVLFNGTFFSEGTLFLCIGCIDLAIDKTYVFKEFYLLSTKGSVFTTHWSNIEKVMMR